MKVNKVLVLALAGLILAVIGCANVYADTWDTQAAVSELNLNRSAEWYLAIDANGTAYYGEQVSWVNGLNNKYSTEAIRPQVSWSEKMRAVWEPWNDPCTYTIGYQQAWVVIETTKKTVTGQSANYISVSHDYTRADGYHYSSTDSHNQYYDKVA